MRCIITKFHGPTNTKGSRISAKAHGLKAKFYSRHAPAFDSLDSEALHNAVANAYAVYLGWSFAFGATDADKLVTGTIDNDTCAHVFTKGA